MEDNSLEKIREELRKRAFPSEDVVQISEAVTKEGDYSPAVPIGFPSFDDALKGGVRDCDFIISTGISGHGKTLWCQNLTLNLIKEGHTTLWFSYEMSIDEINARFKEMGADVSTLKVYTPKHLASGNVDWIHNKIIEAKDKFNAKYIFIDHLDFLLPSKVSKSSVEHKRLLLKDVCMELKSIAIRLGVVIFLVAHVNKVRGRAIEMQDISETSGAYQNADVVFGITRLTETRKRGGKNMEIFKNEGCVRILKNRITGDCPIVDYYVDNKIIKPFEEQVQDYYEVDND